MADGMALPALGLRTDYLSSDSPLRAFQQGRQDGIADEQRNLLKEVGGIASTGNYLEASRRAMAGGDVKTGIDISNWDLDRRKSAYQFLVDGVQRADTPEKYQTLVDMVSKNFGPDMVRGYESFDKRPNAITALQKAEMAFKEKEFASQHSARMAQTNLANAQAELARRKAPSLDETLQTIERFGNGGQSQQQGSTGVPPAGGVGQAAGPPAGIVVDSNPPVSTQPQPASPAPAGQQQKPASSVKDIVARMTPGQRASLALLVQKDDMAGAAKLIQKAESGVSFEDPKDLAHVEHGLRQELAAQSKVFVDVRDAYRRVETVAQNPSPAGDLSLIFNFMKMLDPGSTVREGEFATAQNTTGVPDRIINLYNQVIGGYRLNEEQRGDFSGQARRLYGVQRDQHKQLTDQFKSLAERKGIDPRNVIIDTSSEPSVQPPANRAGQFGSGMGSAVTGPSNPDAGNLLDEARAAIKSGKNRDLVIKRLQELNVDPRGL